MQEERQIQQNIVMIQQNTLIAQLMNLLEEIGQNTQYPYYFNDERCLADHKTYIDLCKYIFPELKEGFLAIENSHLQPPEKLNHLLTILSDELNIDLSKVNGSEILRYNLGHIHRFLVILYEYSKIINENAKRRPIVRSQIGSDDIRQLDAQVSKSARSPPNNYKQYGIQNEDQYFQDRPKEKQDLKNMSKKNTNHPYHQPNGNGKETAAADGHHNGQPRVHYRQTGDYLIPAGSNPSKKQKPKAKAKSKIPKNGHKIRSQRAERENLHSAVVNTIMKEKTRMLEAGVRDNRKNKMEDVESAKEEYRQFLKTYIKQNKAKMSRESNLARKSALSVKPLQQELPMKDFDRIDKFFQSFAYRFRDKKASYLRKISQLIRKQQVDRYCYHNRIERETKDYMEKRLKEELNSVHHQHRVKSALNNENAKNLEVEIEVMRKEEMRVAAQQRFELKKAKKDQLQRIQNVLKFDNDRVLMSLEEGGRLQNLIMKMYKKF